MARDVDEKVVQLSIENKQFNKGVDESVDGLEKLKRALKFEDAGKSLDNLDKNVSKVDMNVLVDGVNKVGLQFSALGTIADAVLRNMTNKVVDSATRMVKSFTIDPVLGGWDKMAEKTQSVATMMAQGFSRESIDTNLSKLAFYADETSYSFTDMTSNIAKFTASGNSLEDSTTALMGIANWAALSGQNAQTASRAMYQLSQAMGAGVMRLEDYKSIQNVSMDTQEFRMKAIEAAKAMGTLEEVSDGVYKSLMSNADAFSINQFASSLTQGAWLTSDVMLKVFSDYGSAVEQIYQYVEENGGTVDQAIKALGSDLDAFGVKALQAAQQARTFGDAITSVIDPVQTRWSSIFESIFGGAEEQIEVFTGLANYLYEIFVTPLDELESVFSDWNATGYNKIFLDSFSLIGEEILKVRDIISNAFTDVFGELDPNVLMDITDKIHAFAEAISLSDKGASNLSSILTNVFSIFKKLIEATKFVTTALFPFLNILNKIAGVTVDLLSRFLSFSAIRLDKFLSAEKLPSIYSNLNNAALAAERFVDSGLEQLILLFDKIGSAVASMFNEVEKTDGRLSDWVSAAITSFSGLFDSLDKIGSAVGDSGSLLSGLISLVGASFRTFSVYISNFVDAFLGAEGEATAAIQVLSTGLSGFFGWVSKMLNSITVEDIKAIGIIASMTYVAFSLGSLLDQFKKIFRDFGEISNPLSSVTVGGFFSGLNEFANKTLVIQIAASIGIIASAIKTLSDIKFEDAVTGMVALGAVFAGVFVLMEQIKKLSVDDSLSTNLIKISASLLVLSVGMQGMAASIQRLASLNFASALQGIVSFGAILGILKVFSESLENANVGKLAALSATMLLLAANITALLAPIALLGFLPIPTIAKGLGALALLLLEIKVFSSSIKEIDVGGLFSVSVAMGLISLAINSMTVAVVALSNLTIPELIAGLSSLAIILGSIVVFADKLGGIDAGRMFGIAGAVTSIAGSLSLISNAIETIGAMDAASVAVAVIALTGSLVAIMGAIAIFDSKVKTLNIANILTLSATLIALSVALIGMASGLKILDGIGWDTIGKGLVGMAGALGIIIGASALLTATGAFAGLIALAAYFGMLAIEIIAVSAAITMLTTAFIDLGEFLIKIGAAALLMGDQFNEVIDASISAFTRMAAGILSAIVDLGPDLTMAIATIIGAIETAIFLSKHKMVLMAISIGLAVIEAIVALGPDLMDGIIKILDVLAAGVPRILERLAWIIEELFAGVGLLIEAALNGLIKMVFNAIGPLGDMIANAIGFDIRSAGEKVGAESVAGLVEGMNSQNETIREGAYQQLQSMIEGYSKGEIELDKTTVDMAVKAVQEYDAAWRKEADSHSPAKLTEGHAEDLALGYKSGAEKNTDKLEDAAEIYVDAYSETAKEGFKEANDEISSNLLTQQNIETMANQGVEAGKAVSQAAGNSAKTELETNVKPEIETTSKDIAQTGVDGAIETLDDSNEDVLKSIAGLPDGADSLLYEQGQMDGQSYVNGVQGSIDNGSLDISGLFNFGSTTSRKFGTVSSELDTLTKQAKAAGRSIQEYLRFDYDYTISKQSLGRLYYGGNIDEETYSILKERWGYIESESKKSAEEAGTEAGLIASLSAGNAIPTGLKSSGGASRAGKQAADDFGSAYSDELSRLNLSDTTAEKTFELWQKQNPNASEAETAAKKAALQTEKVESQTRRVEIAEETWKKTVDKYGEDSDKAVEAFNDYLDAQIKLIDLQNEMTEKQATQVSDQQEAFKRFSEEVKKRYQFFKDVGATDDEIRHILAKETGWTAGLGDENELKRLRDEATQSVTNIGDTVKAGVQDICDNAAEKGKEIPANLAKGIEDNQGVVQVATRVMVDSSIPPMIDEETGQPIGYDWGTNIDEGAKSGIDDNRDRPITASTSMMNDLIDETKAVAEIKSPSGKFIYIGEMIIEGLIVAFENGRSKVVTTLVSIINEAIAAARAAADIHSPSREGEYIGEMIDMGIVKGFGNYAANVKASALQVVDDTLNAAEDEGNSFYDKLDDYVNSKLGNGVSVVVNLDANTSELDEKISKYQDLVGDYNRSYNQIKGAYEGQGELQRIRAMSDRLGGAFLEGDFERYQILQRRLANTLGAARAASGVDEAYGDIKIAQHLMEIENYLKEMSQVYSTHGLDVTLNQTNVSPNPLSRKDIYRDTQQLLKSFQKSMDKNSARRG